MKLMTWVLTVAFFTASFDLILTVNVGGTLRLAQVMMILVILASIAQIIQRHAILWPRGGTALALWCALQGLLIIRSDEILISVQLYILMLLAALGVFAMLQVFGRSEWLPVVFRRYLMSYVFVAGFGLLQFITPALHLGELLIAQWLVRPIVPRLNGFSYEPSYFATYLILGWVLLLDLRLSKAKVSEGRKWLWALLLISAILFLSTSKTAWLAMGLEGLLRVYPTVRRYVGGQAERLRSGRLTTPLPRLRSMLVTAVMLVTVLGGLTVLNKVILLTTFLQGTGLGGTAAHSFNDRNKRFWSTLEVAKENPWMGVSLGGVASKVAVLEGAKATTVDEQKLYWGFPVIVDTLAASGIPAFIPFVWFFAIIMLGDRKLIRERWETDERAKWLHALVRALALEWFALLSDQFLLRVYLWLHIGMVVLVAYQLRYVPAKRLQEQAEERLVAA